MSTPFNYKIKTYSFDHGSLEGRLVSLPTSEDLVIITNGHNGFYSYGMFPALQEGLAQSNISSFNYNFSHGGTRGDEDVFSDLDAYAKNCMRLESADLVQIVSALHQEFPNHKLWLLAHSMGSIPTIFGARELVNAGFHLEGILLLAPVSRIDFWPEELIDQWKKSGTLMMFNRRTGQDLPHGPEFLEEILEASTTWNVQQALQVIPVDLLVIHGEEDESVSPEHGRTLVRIAQESGHRASFVGIPHTGHTFGTKHPFEGMTPALERVLENVVSFIRSGG